MQRAIRITPVAGEPVACRMRLEMWGAHRKSQLLAELAGVPVEIVAPDGAVLSSDDTTATPTSDRVGIDQLGFTER